MKYTKILILFVVLMALVSFCGAEDAPVLKTSLLRYDPTPAEPGNYATVYIQIENTGGTETKNARIEFQDSYPFSIDEERIKDIGILSSGQTYVTNFRVRIDQNAIEGENEIKFVITDDYNLNVFTEKVFNINILTQDADVSFEKITLTPNELNPGQKGKITINLKNNADSFLKDISIQLILQSLVGASVVDLPFAIEDSVSEKTIDILQSSQTHIVEYDLIAYPGVESGIYKIPVVLKFYDSTGQDYTKNDFITVIVNPKIDVYMVLERSDLSKEAKSGEVVIRIVNKGFGKIKSANLIFEENDDISIVTPYNQIYIGNIDSDDYETAEINIKANSDTINIPVKLDFKDALNKDHEIKENLTLKIYSQKELGQSSGNTFWYVLLFIVIIAAGFWYFKRKKHKK